jgi:lipopolysaccharide/colanic/teichoic acid biosynthesis glycosyltransferase
MVQIHDSLDHTRPAFDSRLAFGGPVSLSRKQAFLVGKRAFDIVFSLLLLPVVVLFALMLLALNPVFNRGPLFYRQQRMGQFCKPFTIYKFRSMTPAGAVKRSANCPLETDRITPLGRFIRQVRIDELPQLLNVLKGDMSLIGPRPDFAEHAETYVDTVPGYLDRHVAKPGISGLAQVRLGYIEGESATRRKARIDNFYIKNMGLRLEAWIFVQTVAVVLGRIGAK